MIKPLQFLYVLALLLSAITLTNAQLPQRLKDLKIDLQRHLFENLTYPDVAERTYKQGKTVAYFKVVNKHVTLLAVAPKLDINFKNEIIKSFKAYKTNDLKDGRYGIPIHFGIHNVITKKINPEVEVHPSYIDLPYVEIYTGQPNRCNPSAPHTYCEEGTLHTWYNLQTPPIFQPGKDLREFFKFVEANIKYPKKALNNKVQGQIFASFVIEKDGSLTEATINRSLGYGTDEEALRVLSLSPKWKPGLENGKPVRTYCVIPIKFYPAKPFKNPKPIKIYKLKDLKNPPQYPGGKEKLASFIKKNLNYAAIANKTVKGRIVVQALVEMDGSLTNIKTNDNLGFGTKKEAIRVVGKLKRWNPGMENGIPTRTEVFIPVIFNP